jgi:hypothetical protein
MRGGLQLSLLTIRDGYLACDGQRGVVALFPGVVAVNASFPGEQVACDSPCCGKTPCLNNGLEPADAAR